MYIKNTDKTFKYMKEMMTFPIQALIREAEIHKANTCL